MGLDFPSGVPVLQKRYYLVVFVEDVGLASVDIVSNLRVKSNGIRVVRTLANTYFPPGGEQVRIDIYRPVGSGSNKIAGVPSFGTVKGVVRYGGLVVAIESVLGMVVVFQAGEVSMVAGIASRRRESRSPPVDIVASVIGSTNACFNRVGIGVRGLVNYGT